MKSIQTLFLLSLTLLGISLTGSSQTSATGYFDLGEHQASNGGYLRNAYRVSDSVSLWNLGTGAQLDIKSNHNPNFISAYDVFVERNVKIKKRTFSVQGHYMVNRFTDYMRETNVSISVINKELKHFTFKLGYNHKLYRINKAGREEFTTPKGDSKLGEGLNLIYSATVLLKPQGNKWNIGLTGTNQDYYLINQSTNPMLYVDFNYRSEQALSYFMEFWYKQAGVLNISANYFGYTIRGGVKWEF